MKELEIAKKNWPEKMTLNGFNEKFEEFLSTPKGVYLGVNVLTKDISKSDTKI